MTNETPQEQTLPLPDPKLIQELFDKDPLQLSTQDLDVIIGEFRSGRMAYLNPPAAAEKVKAPKGKGGKVSVIDIDQLDIDDLLAGT